MRVYVFSSTNLTNIWAGIGARRWAVSLNQGENQSIRTKAAKMPIGALGILYCVEKQSFSTPFLIISEVDLKLTVVDIWPEPWVLPFEMLPLGSPINQISKDKLKDIMPSLMSGGRWDHLLHIQPSTVFTPSEITDKDWSALVSGLIKA